MLEGLFFNLFLRAIRFETSDELSEIYNCAQIWLLPPKKFVTYLVDDFGIRIGLGLGVDGRWLPISSICDPFVAVIVGGFLSIAAQVLRGVLFLERVRLLGGLAVRADLSDSLHDCLLCFLGGAQIFLCH